MSPDTVVPGGANPQAQNRYTYGFNNPAKYTDPTGHWPDPYQLFRDPIGELSELWNDQYRVVSAVLAGERDPMKIVGLQFGLDRDLPPVAARLAELNEDTRMVFSNAPLEERLPHCIDLGLWATGTAAQTVGVGQGLATVRAAWSPASLSGAPALVPELGNKLDYPLGNASGSPKNIQRSLTMASQLNRIGIGDTPDGRAYLTEHLTGVLNDKSNILLTEANGRVTRESLLMGPGGGLKMRSIWEETKLITIMLFGGGGR